MLLKRDISILRANSVSGSPVSARNDTESLIHVLTMHVENIHNLKLLY